MRTPTGLGGRRSLRRLFGALSSVALVMVFAVLPAAPAAALGPDCTADPPLSLPTNGPVGALDPTGPAEKASGDPFAPNADLTVYQAYGYGGIAWVNYDLGCGPDGVIDPSAAGGGFLSGQSLMLLTSFVAAIGTFLRWAFNPETLAIFEPVQQFGAKAFGEGLFLPLFGFVLAGVGIYVLGQHRKGEVAQAARSGLGAVMVGLIAILCFTYPLTLGGYATKALTGVVGAANQGVAGAAGSPSEDVGDAVAGNLQRSILYQTWLAGNFGRYNGDTAETYGPQLFRASTMSYDEIDAIAADDDPDAVGDLIEAKADSYREIAEEIKESDPAAYQYLAGHRNTDRFGYTLLGWLSALAAGAFLVFASILMIFSLLIVGIAVAVAPLLALPAAIPRFRHLLTGMFDYLLGALWTAAVFGSVTALYVAAIGYLLSPTAGVNPFLAAVLLLVLTAVAWRVSKPFRSIRGLTRPRFAPPPGPETDAERVRRSSDPATPYASTGSGPSPRYVDSTPAEARVGRAALSGAIQGAAMGAVGAGFTGGASIAAGARLGAARGAAVAGSAATAGALTGSAAVATAAGDAAGRSVGAGFGGGALGGPTASVDSVDRGPAMQGAPSESTSPQDTGPRATTAGPARQAIEMTLYRPGQPLPGSPVSRSAVARSGDGVPVYQVYSPAPAAPHREREEVMV